MNLLSIHALSPLDGRYSQRLSPIRQFFSEYALIKYRLKIEVEYVIFFVEKTGRVELSKSDKKTLQNIYEHFSEPAAQRVKELEKKCHHDVKAVEYFLQEELKKEKLEKLVPYIHIGLTSEDTNSCAYGLSLKEALSEVILPELITVIEALVSFAQSNAQTVMLARTHGQPAVSTTLGKEVIVFASRLEKATKALHAVKIEAKVSGAVGNWNAHQATLSQYDWMALSEEFISHLGLQSTPISTQIVPAESYTECFQALVRINTILIDCVRDLWQYISDEYLLQTVAESQVGSSTMPQKVNPIDLENSEGNAGVAIALLQHFVEKLPISRLQRDLSDSTVKRSIGTALGHTYLALTSLQNGLQKIQPNTEKMKQRVEDHPEVLAEALQTALRLSGKADAYEILRDMTRGKAISKVDMDQVAQQITDPSLKQKFLDLQPSTYVGNAALIVSREVVRITQELAQLRKV